MIPDLEVHIGGDASLDFVNTVSGHRKGKAHDNLAIYGDLVVWAQSAQIISAAQARKLEALALKNPGPAAATLRAAHVLREGLHGMFERLAQNRSVAAHDMAVLNKALRRGLAHAVLKHQDKALVWSWEDDGEAIDAMLWPVARAAADLFVSCGYTRMKECANDGCGWLFLDTSKNGSRRWCDMSGCGNRAKVRAYRAKHADA